MATQRAPRPQGPAPSSGMNQDEDEGVSEQVSTEIFSSYECVTIDHPGAIQHPGDIAEPASLSAIRLPQNDYPLFDALGDELVNAGKLSKLQLEGVRYACRKHLEMLPSGSRAGFFIGDGAGVGKGRQISGIVCDNYCRGRTKHLWVSTSTDLHADAERDLRDLGMQLTVINNCAALDAATKVFKWLGGADFDGCLVFDECHRAKNFAVGNDAASTKVATAVVELQRAMPQARVVYCSATGVSEVGHMAYLERMGLWGPGSAFADFEAFLNSMKGRGVSFLEMLAMELKNEGKYVARGLSFRAAEFSHVPCRLTAEQVEVYNGAVCMWQTVRRELAAAIELTGGSGQGAAGGNVWRMFWSAQQRFFKLLCVSLKTPTVVQAAEKALQDGCCVVIGLQSTGEAAVDALKLRPGQPCGWVSATKETLRKFVKSHFPTRRNTKADKLLSLQRKAAGDASNNTSAQEKGQVDSGVDVPECIEKRDALIQQISDLKLPPHFLDELIDKLGGPKKVAEMTGRSTRVERQNGKPVFAVRAASDSSDMDSLNIMEKDAFMKGQKLVAILSDAASTGISLHALRGAKNTRRRVHLTIELPWSADKAIQQLGRSHRSNQTTAPLYGLVTTDVGGEARFAAAVARRLQSLGALTRGDRRAASGVDLSEQNFDSPLGRLALRNMYDAVVGGAVDLQPGVTLSAICAGVDVQHAGVPELVGPKETEFANLSPTRLQVLVSALHSSMLQAVDMMGVGGNVPVLDDSMSEDQKSITGFSSAHLPESAKELGDVRRFLNRLLGLPIARQNLLFNYFTATLAACIRSAKAEGRYSEGMSDMPASNISEAQTPETLWTDPHSGLKTLKHSLRMDRGISFSTAVERLERERREGDGVSGFYVSRRDIFGRKLVLLATATVKQGISFFDMDRMDLNSRYMAAKPEQVEELWQEIYDGCYEHCIHGKSCPSGSACVQGRRITTVTILSGSIVRVWGVLEQVLQRHEHELNKADRSMRIIKVDMATAAQPDRPALVGVRYKHTLLPEVVSLLSQLHASVKARETGTSATQHQLAQHMNRLEELGAAAVVKKEPVTPVNVKLRAKLFRPPTNLKNFFQVKGASPPGAPGSTHPQKYDRGQDKIFRPRSACKRTAQGPTLAPTDGVIDLIEDSPLKKKVPKVEPVKQEEYLVPEHPAREPRLQESARGNTGGPACTANETAAGIDEAPKGSVPKVRNPDEPSKGGMNHGGCTPQPAFVHKASRRSTEVKQPLCEKRQNRLEQTDDQRQPKLLMGARRAVKHQSLDTDVAGLEHVIAMGFDRTQSRVALRTCGGDTNRAIEFLLNGR